MCFFRDFFCPSKCWECWFTWAPAFRKSAWSGGEELYPNWCFRPSTRLRREWINPGADQAFHLAGWYRVLPGAQYCDRLLLNIVGERAGFLCEFIYDFFLRRILKLGCVAHTIIISIIWSGPVPRREGWFCSVHAKANSSIIQLLTTIFGISTIHSPSSVTKFITIIGSACTSSTTTSAKVAFKLSDAERRRGLLGGVDTFFWKPRWQKKKSE